MGLDTSIAAVLPDNTDEQISPADLRTALGYITASIDDHEGFSAAVAAAYQAKDSDLTTIAAANNGTVLAATTASFTTADETKLDGIEAAADVTDAANVSAAGAVMVANNLSDVVAATAFGNIKQAASESATGVVELATTAEATTGTDTARAVTAAGVKAVMDAHVAAADPHTGYLKESLVDAKGDILVGTAADTPGIIAAGANGSFLTANSGTASGLEWITSIDAADVDFFGTDGDTAFTTLFTLATAPAFTVIPFTGPAYSQTNFAIQTQSNSRYLAGYLSSSGAQNAEVVFRLPQTLQAGTWTFRLVHSTNSSNGIYTIATSSDGSSWSDLTTIDGYAGSVVAAVVTDATALTVPAGVAFIRVKMATKNASSSNYYGVFSAISGVRTA